MSRPTNWQRPPQKWGFACTQSATQTASIRKPVFSSFMTHSRYMQAACHALDMSYNLHSINQLHRHKSTR